MAFSAAHTQDTAILPLRLVGVRVRGGGAFTLPSASESGPMSMLPCIVHVSVPEILVHRRKASNRTIIGGLERRDDRRARRLLQTGHRGVFVL